MGQSAVILVIAATLTVGILVFASQRSTSDADVELASYHEKVLAREAASTGMNMTVRRLVDDPDSWMLSPGSYAYTNQPYYGATFTTVVTSTHVDTVDVVSTGVDNNGTHVIEARYAKGFTTLGVPPSLKYAIISEDDLTFNGQGAKKEIRALTEESNANVHTNGDLTTHGNKVHIEGYGSYAPGGEAHITPEKSVDSIFDPNTDENGADANVYEYEEVDIPELVADDYNSMPPASYMTMGDTTLSGVVDLQAWASSLGLPAEVGTAEHPFLLYIEGSVDLSGGVTVLGYGQIVANGDINVSGNVTSSTEPEPASGTPEWEEWAATNLDAAGNTTIGYYATGNFTMTGNFTVVGQVFANGSVTLGGGGSGQTNVLGGVVSANSSITMNGGIELWYAQISEATVLPGWEVIVPEGVRLISWAEF